MLNNILKKLESQSLSAEEQTYLSENIGYLFNESDQNFQLQLLEIFIQMPPIEQISKDNMFWYHFMDKFYNSSNKEVLRKSKEFFSNIFQKVDSALLTQLACDFMKKNNAKITISFLNILLAHKDKLELD